MDKFKPKSAAKAKSVKRKTTRKTKSTVEETSS